MEFHLESDTSTGSDHMAPLFIGYAVWTKGYTSLNTHIPHH